MSQPGLPHQDVVSSSSLFPDLMRVSGGFGQITGAGMFMVRTIIAGTTTAVTIGLAGATVGALIYGTATLPFLFSACVGFCVGSLAFYRDAVRRSETALLRYPELMRMHLDGGFPTIGFLAWSRQDLTLQRFRSHWTLRSMLVASWLGAQPALERIFEAREQERVDAYSTLMQQADVHVEDEVQERKAI